MGVWKPAKSPYWHYDFQFKGRRFHGSTGLDARRKAEEYERRKRTEAALGIPADGGMTLHEATSRWWHEVGQRRAEPEAILRRIETALRLLGKSTPVAKITTNDLSRAIEVRRSETFTRSPKSGAKLYHLSNATVNLDVIGIVRPVLSRARRTWEIPGLREIDWASIVLVEPPPRIQFYTAEQESAWLAECDDASRMPLRLLLTYGMRYGELFFPPQAYDHSGPRLILAKRKKDPHVLPLRVDDAAQLSARVGRAIAAGLYTVWFEADDRGDLVPLTYYGLQTRLRSAAKRAGVPPGRVIHGARHHAGTAILRETGNLKIAQQLLGHVDIKSTLRYAHALERDVRAGLDAKSRNSPEPPIPDAGFIPAKQRRKARPTGLS